MKQKPEDNQEKIHLGLRSTLSQLSEQKQKLEREQELEKELEQASLDKKPMPRSLKKFTRKLILSGFFILAFVAYLSMRY